MGRQLRNSTKLSWGIEGKAGVLTSLGPSRMIQAGSGANKDPQFYPLQSQCCLKKAISSGQHGQGDEGPAPTSSPKRMLQAGGDAASRGPFLPQGCSLLGNVPAPGMQHLGDHPWLWARHEAAGCWQAYGPPASSWVLAPVAAWHNSSLWGQLSSEARERQRWPAWGKGRWRSRKVAVGRCSEASARREGAVVESQQRVERKVLTPKGGPGTPGTTTPSTAEPGRVSGV